jgi:NTE family protein
MPLDDQECAGNLPNSDRRPAGAIDPEICSDLTKVRLSRAATASSAAPLVLSPVTFNNYGGHCGFRFLSWVREVATRPGADTNMERARRRCDELQELQDSHARSFLHLVDGGVSDNVAMRAIVELLQTST